MNTTFADAPLPSTNVQLARICWAGAATLHMTLVDAYRVFDAIAANAIHQTCSLRTANRFMRDQFEGCKVTVYDHDMTIAVVPVAPSGDSMSKWRFVLDQNGN